MYSWYLEFREWSPPTREGGGGSTMLLTMSWCTYWALTPYPQVNYVHVLTRFCTCVTCMDCGHASPLCSGNITNYYSLAIGQWNCWTVQSDHPEHASQICCWKESWQDYLDLCLLHFQEWVHQVFTVLKSCRIESVSSLLTLLVQETEVLQNLPFDEDITSHSEHTETRKQQLEALKTNILKALSM